jgi:predicted RNA-binding protein (virulence factor B family)
VAVEDIYDGLVLQQEVMGKYTVGDVLDLYVSKINDNGQLVMSFRKAAHLQLDDDAQHILEALKRNKGYLPYNDASPAEVIRSHFGMSKKAFKRALGRLYKEKSVILLEEGISIFVDNDPENQ